MQVWSRRPWLVATAGSLLASRPVSASAGTVLTMVNTVYPPFVNEPGDPGGEGLDVELARELLRRAGYGMQLRLRPWKRVLLELETGQADFTTTISRRDDRDRFLAWSPAYRKGADYCFYARPDAVHALSQLDDLRGRTLGVVSGFHYPPPLLEVPGLRLVPGRDVAMLVQMLLARRSDFMVATAIAGAWELRQRGLQQQLQRQAYVYRSDSPNYLGFSRARPQALAALPAVAAALEGMVKDGTLRRIERRYTE